MNLPKKNIQYNMHCNNLEKKGKVGMKQRRASCSTIDGNHSGLEALSEQKVPC
jgi:hypothetical protein